MIAGFAFQGIYGNTIPSAPVSEESAYAKVAWRIIPLLFVCYICAYLDRVNVGFAKLQMQADIPGISDSVYGVGAGMDYGLDKTERLRTLCCSRGDGYRCGIGPFLCAAEDNSGAGLAPYPPLNDKA